MRRIDWVGFVTFSVSLFLLVFALVRGNDLGWGSTDHRRPARRRRPSSWWRSSSTSGARATRCWTSACSRSRPSSGLSVVAFTPGGLHLRHVPVPDPLHPGQPGLRPAGRPALRFLPHDAGSSSSWSFFAGRLTVRVQSRFLLGIGMLVVTGGLLLMATTHPNSTWTVLLPGFIVCGFGVGIVNPVLASGAVSVVQPQRSGMASGANNTFRQVGIATGIAVLGAVFQSQIVAHTTAALDKTRLRPRGAPPGRCATPGRHVGGRGAPGGRPRSRRRGPQRAAATPTTRASRPRLNHLMDIGAVVAFVGALCAFALVRQRDFIVPTATAAARRAARRRQGPRAGAGAPADAGVPAAMPEPFTLEGTLRPARAAARGAHPGAWSRRRREDRSNLPVDLHARRARADDRLRPRRPGQGGVGRTRGLRHRPQGRRAGRGRPGRRRHPLLRDRLLAVATGGEPPAPRRARRGRHRLHLAGRARRSARRSTPRRSC